MVVNRLTKNSYAFLSDLDNIVSMSASYIDIRSGRPNIKTRLRSDVMWSNLVLMSHNARSISIVLKKRQIYSAQVLLRVLIEQWINMNYFYYTRTYEALVCFINHDEIDFMEQIEKFQEFTKKENSEGFTDVDLKAIKKSINESKTDLSKYGFTLKKMPNIRTRASLIDKANGNYNLESLYLTWYSAHCMVTHSSSNILHSMNSVKTLDEFMTGYTKDDNMDIIIVLTNQLLSSAIRFVRQKSKLKIPSEGLDVIRIYNKYG